ncbi:MAG: methylenetetrahydrofolate reductase [NAD(P)H] [Candidatus Omnitrophica bacterium]|nr:methylenetetrahydrofolate reductase [NAD(P)H] [Candidatus Omnitrophota bacterium]
MKINEILASRDEGISFEFFPPKSEKTNRALSRTIEILKGYHPLYMSMTYGAGGVAQDKTKEAVHMLTQYPDLVVMPHLTCIGAKTGELKMLLDHYKDQGIENIMALRGDPPQDETGPYISDTHDLCYAKDLVALLKREYNDFCVGVAVYPEGHIETNSLEEDLKYTKQKIDAGADFAVTQMFFDNTYYFSLLDRFEEAGISIEVLPGILPLTDIVKVKQFAAICRATVPRHIEETMNSFKDPGDRERAGIDFTITQCRELKKYGVKKFHFFTLNKPEIITSILDAI